MEIIALIKEYGKVIGLVSIIVSTILLGLVYKFSDPKLHAKNPLSFYFSMGVLVIYLVFSLLMVLLNSYLKGVFGLIMKAIYSLLIAL